MNNQPFSFHTPEQERFVAAIMDHPLIALYRCFYIHISDSPREIAFDVRFDIRKIQLETIECITLRFDMVLDQVREAVVLSAGFDVTSTIEIQKMLPKRLPIGLFPALFHRIDDRNKRR